jgi:hypothetical protein
MSMQASVGRLAIANGSFEIAGYRRNATTVPSSDWSLLARRGISSMDVAAIVATYGAAWTAESDALRRQYLEEAWADEGVYIDPTAEITGRDALAVHMAGLQDRFPGARIEMTSAVDTHHGKLRFKWQLAAADGAILTEGMDFGELGPDGRLQRIVGFFGPLQRFSKPTGSD